MTYCRRVNKTEHTVELERCKALVKGKMLNKQLITETSLYLTKSYNETFVQCY